MSQCSKQTEEMQERSYLKGKKKETMVEQLCGYFALHVSVAHFAPYSGTPLKRAVLQGMDRYRDPSIGVAVPVATRQKRNRLKPLLIWLETVRNECSVAHTGFEPVISALRGRCPRPLDECALLRAIS